MAIHAIKDPNVSIKNIGKYMHLKEIQGLEEDKIIDSEENGLLTHYQVCNLHG